eukprot:TRINITY_DN1186_c0_g1_i3.p1 TRINITY_DN1186_c0_g1~~TRINITY_DN1186_c0_g1_i3.p1  ORF type:complete len:314 (+),score=30.47 TRINITY_DN1186_c0_g1_i3:238-1179(+)
MGIPCSKTKPRFHEKTLEEETSAFLDSFASIANVVSNPDLGPLEKEKLIDEAANVQNRFYNYHRGCLLELYISDRAEYLKKLGEIDELIKPLIDGLCETQEEKVCKTVSGLIKIRTLEDRVIWSSQGLQPGFLESWKELKARYYGSPKFSIKPNSLLRFIIENAEDDHMINHALSNISTYYLKENKFEAYNTNVETVLMEKLCSSCQSDRILEEIKKNRVLIHYLTVETTKQMMKVEPTSNLIYVILCEYGWNCLDECGVDAEELNDAGHVWDSVRKLCEIDSITLGVSRIDTIMKLCKKIDLGVKLLKTEMY